MKQYNSIKLKYPDAMLLFRVGDFYETFGEDAVKAARILNIVLTNRNNGGERTELAGFPHHSLNTYLPKLVRAGQRVAICDQLEDPKMTKTIVKRGVTELVTPGVAFNDDILNSKSNNFLCAVHFGKKNLGISFLDISTGEFLCAQGNQEYIDKLLQNFSPSEILVQKKYKKDFTSAFGKDHHCFFLDDWIFKSDYAHETLNDQFGTKSLKGFGVDHLEEGIVASGAVLYYLGETRHHRLQHIVSLNRIAEEQYVWMDRFTIRNLELYHSNAANAVTLLDVIDKTISPMGGRLLKRWLALPLKDANLIEQRLEVVDFLLKNPDRLERIQEQLREMSDLERLISKVATQKISPREVNQLRHSLNAIMPIKELALECDNEAIRVIGDTLNSCDLLRSKISESITEEAPVNVQKGNVIAKGFSSELDDLRAIAFSGKDYLDNMIKRETQETGITSLKIGKNNVYGYYIEVRNTHKDKVPETWNRKQTLVNAERDITEELKEYENKILGAEERIAVLEQELYVKLVQWMLPFIDAIQQTAKGIAQLDCLTSFALQAKTAHYTRPLLDDTFDLDIKEGRHPVIEKQLPPDTPYIANDVFLDKENQQIIV